MTVPTGRESDKFVLRLPDGMRDRIKAAAEMNNRSMNAEIVATLEAVYPAEQMGLGEAFSLWMEMSEGIENMSDDEKLRLVERFRRRAVSSSLSVALSGGVLKLIQTTVPPYAAEMSIPLFEGAAEVADTMRKYSGSLSKVP